MTEPRPSVSQLHTTPHTVTDAHPGAPRTALLPALNHKHCERCSAWPPITCPRRSGCKGSRPRSAYAPVAYVVKPAAYLVLEDFKTHVLKRFWNWYSTPFRDPEEAE